MRYEYFHHIFLGEGDAPLLALKNGRSVSRSQFFEHAIRLLNFLVAQGVRRGDRVVVCLDNQPEYLELVVAMAIGGITVCPVPSDLPVAQLKRVQEVTRAKLTITAYDQLAYSLNTTVPDCAKEGGLDEPFLVIFSSGTTGLPKGIVQSTRNFFESAKAFARAVGHQRGERSLHNWPMFYNAGLFNLFACPLVTYGEIVIGERFSARTLAQFWQEIELFHPHWIYLSPTMAISLCRTAKFVGKTENALANTTVISTSSILYPSIKREFLSTFNKHILPCFGITELGGSFTIGSAESRPFSVGKPIEGVRVSIDEAGDCELVVETPYMALGYLGQDGCITLFDRTEPFRSGDLGWIEGSELFVSGRKRDSIKKGGEYISLSEIEDMVIASGLCEECIAVGRPDAFWGEVYDVMFVALPNMRDEDVSNALTQLFNERLPQSLRPSGIKGVSEIAKTASGKPLKRPVDYQNIAA